MVSDQEVIAVLVKERERCRQLVQLYQTIRQALTPHGPDSESLDVANRILTHVLGQLHGLPRKPVDALSEEDARQDARRLLREIGDLLERAIVAEREVREGVRRSPLPPPAGMTRTHALRMYAAV